MSQDPLQIDLKSEDEKVCEKKEEDDETDEVDDKGRIEPTKKNKSRVPKIFLQIIKLESLRKSC